MRHLEKLYTCIATATATEMKAWVLFLSHRLEIGRDKQDFG